PPAALRHGVERIHEARHVLACQLGQVIGVEVERRLDRGPLERLLRVGMDTERDELLACAEHLDRVLLAVLVDPTVLDLAEGLVGAEQQQALGRLAYADRRLGGEVFEAPRLHLLCRVGVVDVDVDGGSVPRLDADVRARVLGEPLRAERGVRGDRGPLADARALPAERRDVMTGVVSLLRYVAEALRGFHCDRPPGRQGYQLPRYSTGHN